MSDTVKVIARFEEPFWRDAGLAGAALSHVGPFCEFHDDSGPDTGQAALFGFAPAATSPAAPSSFWYYGTPVLRLPHLDDRLLFGSAETASAFPGYLEGAVLAGRRAAGQALDRVA